MGQHGGSRRLQNLCTAQVSRFRSEVGIHNPRTGGGGLLADVGQVSDGEVQAVVDRTQIRTGFADGGQSAVNGVDCTLSTDRKSTRLNSSHVAISYAILCLKKKIT